MRAEVFSFFFIFFKKIFTDPNCPLSHQPCWISVGVTEADLSSVVSVDNLPKKSEAQPRRKLCEKDPPEDPWGEQFFFFEFTRHGREGYQGEKVRLFKSTGK
jgi:hypothetical protein